MPAALGVRILTPMGEVLDTRAMYLRVTAWNGLLGVMAGHAPMVAQLTIGALRLTGSGGDVRHFATTGGVLRVTRTSALVLVDAAEEADEIDVERAREALARAQHRLAEATAVSVDVARAELALARALNRLQVADQARP